MSGMQRRKGAVGEREVVEELNRMGMLCHRTAQRMGKAGDAADVVCVGLDVHIEVKRRENLAWKATLEQAERDAHGKPWVIVHRPNGGRWVVIQPLEQWVADSVAAHSAVMERRDIMDKAAEE